MTSLLQRIGVFSTMQSSKFNIQQSQNKISYWWRQQSF